MPGAPAGGVQAKEKSPACDETRPRLREKHANADDNERRLRAWARVKGLRDEFNSAGDNETKLLALSTTLEVYNLGIFSVAYPDAYLKCLRSEIPGLRNQVRHKLGLEEESE
jgi:hypothetical protein